MDDPPDTEWEWEHIEPFKEELQTNGAAAAAEKINAYLKEWDTIPLNIAITGETGSGKSTFVNAFRGLDKKDQSAAAAPTGSVETTKEVKPYPHPNFPNVTLWDLPGIGTTNFPAAKYLEHVGFERFDFFIIISADRFRENDVKLAKEIQRMEKKFYFVRSKMDHSMRDEEDTQPDFNEEKTLAKIRVDCVQGLENQGMRSPQVFLVSSRQLHLYDFDLLQETLERELPAHKRGVLLLAMPIVNLEIINKKKEALQSKIKQVNAKCMI
ncbi:interferon-inducible GTPase 1-like [Notothenia coriiceps]|uniref:Interferon-inducible GTPase 1-like n=1 Tax=Notothenia coriiceps TaxID=8208 RepID=A0A6I9PNR1_9TELE|nr:PREDICTED: interferon-inducible GTPase 1-like [Notothenia coriiceps]